MARKYDFISELYAQSPPTTLALYYLSNQHNKNCVKPTMCGIQILRVLQSMGERLLLII